MACNACPRTLNTHESCKALSVAHLSYCEHELHTALGPRAATTDDRASVVAIGRNWAHGLRFQAKVASQGLRKSRCQSVKWPVGRKQEIWALRDPGRLSRAPMAPSTHRTNPLRATPAVTTPWAAVKVGLKVGPNIRGRKHMFCVLRQRGNHSLSTQLIIFR